MLRPIFRRLGAAPVRVMNVIARMRRLAVLSTKLHAAAIRMSRGRLARSYLFSGGLPVLLLTTTGRQSGKPRTTPVAYMPHRDGFAVIPTNAGTERPPAWKLNLEAAGRGRVEVHGEVHDVTLRIADAEEAAGIWSQFVAGNPAVGAYRDMTDRQIPAFVLERERPPAVSRRRRDR